MITEWFIQRWQDFLTWFLGIFSPADFELPDWFVNFDDSLNDVMEAGGVLIAWFEWAGMLAVAGVVLFIYSIGLGAKTLRAIAAHLPFVGGAG